MRGLLTTFVACAVVDVASPASRADVAYAACALALLDAGADGQTTGAKLEDDYPNGPKNLKCFYSNKVGRNTGYASNSDLEAILCPEGQNKFCVRQVVNGLARTECGMTEYFGDKYYTLSNDDQECMFLKCSDTCDEDQLDVHSEYIEEFREDATYTRDTLCCKTDYCNAAGGLRPAAGAVLFSVAALAFLR